MYAVGGPTSRGFGNEVTTYYATCGDNNHTPIVRIASEIKRDKAKRT